MGLDGTWSHAVAGSLPGWAETRSPGARRGSGNIDAMKLWTVATVVFFLNVPFGWWRSRVRRFSRQWLMAVHLPVPAVVALRIITGLGWYFATFPVLVGAFLFGQLAGGGLNRLLAKLSWYGL